MIAAGCLLLAAYAAILVYDLSQRRHGREISDDWKCAGGIAITFGPPLLALGLLIELWSLLP